MDEVSTSKEGEVETLELTEDDGFSSPSAMAPTWRPRQLAFSPYSSVIGTDAQNLTSSTVVRRPLVSRLTEDILSTYQRCNPKFQYSNELIPKRFLTSPHIGLLNDGYDNENSDLILIVNRPLVNLETQRRYIIKEILGQGTFGQVAKCLIEKTHTFVAVKIIKNLPAYYQQALVEVSILTTLNKKFDPEDRHHIVRIYDYFVHQRHLCIAFELLDSNLYEILKMNDYRGISLSIVQLFSKQILRGLALMKDAGIIHCDLKPENILLCTRVKPAEIKIIDFGSACMEDRTVYSYIQSRYYRSPEVLLGYQYSTAIDMWSFGCIVAELYLGLPLFPGLSEFDLLTRMLDILGGQPPDYILKEAKNTSKFFKFVGSVNNEESGHMIKQSAYQVLTLEEYEARESKSPKIGKDYYIDMDLKDIVTKYPYRQNLSDEDVLKESRVRLALVDFLKGLVEFDPAKRWSPLQASKHPFVTGEPFTCPYTPSPETPRMSVSQNIKVDHHPAGGHWFAAGLSPNVSGGNRVALHNSPHYQMISYAHAGGSYGSLGSHGSYQDGGVGAGSSYGSYGDNNNNINNNNMLPFYSPVGPSGMNMHHHAQGGVPILGTSPDARRRIIHNNFPHGNTGVGFSPTGNFAPMSLGTSPSQFTPPNSSYGQISPGSHYGPSSPARGNSHGSPLGKVAAVGQFNNRRKNWGYSGNLQSPESSFSSSSHWQGLYSDAEGNSPVQAWRQQQGGGGGGGKNGGYSPSHNFLSVPTHGSNMQFLHPKGVAIHDKPEASNSLPDPGDWDPNYSEELLLEEDASEVNLMSNEFSKSMHLIQHTDPLVAVRRFNRTSNASSNIPPPMQRQNGAIQGFTHGDVGSPPSSHDLHIGYGPSPPMTKPPSHLMPHFSQNSPSRLGQQPRFNHGRSTAVRGNDWNHVMLHHQQQQQQQHPFSSFNSGGPRSPGSNGGSPWGRRGNHSIVSNIPPPTSRGRKDYGRIA